MDKLVSILIPVFNRVNLVGFSIEAALQQTYDNIEIIIVDNCSTDGTWDLISRYAEKDKRIRVIQNQENIGPVANWKRCIDEANGEYAKILFSDDLISENFVEETLGIFDDETAFILSAIEVFTDDTHKTASNYAHKNTYTIEEYYENILFFNSRRFPVSPGCALFRTADLKNSLEVDIPNPLNLDFSQYGAGNDLLLFLNTSCFYKYIKISSNTISYFRSHDNSFTISNQLAKYYNYSKLYFIIKQKPSLLPKFKSFSWLKMKKKNTYNIIYPLIPGRINWYYLISAVFIRVFRRCK